MLFVELVLLGLAIAGHGVFWVALVNRVHSIGWPQWFIDVLSIVCWVLCLAIPLLAFAAHASGIEAMLPLSDVNGYLLVYLSGCWLMVVAAIIHRIADNRRSDRSSVLLSNHTRKVDVVEVLGHRPVGDFATGLLTRLPGNEVLRIHIQNKALSIPRLDPALDGLTIAHISDLHLSGRIEEAYFREVFRLANEAQADFVAVTGDLFDDERCIDWGIDVLSELEGRYGVYFILGNHDLRVDSRRVRRLLAERGLTDLGGRWQEITARGQSVILAGNELPWFKPAADMQGCPSRDAATSQLRLLLSHAPDQLTWARRFDFDLMLAGHTHGGQIRLPLLGPIVSPSRLGTQYASGTFEREPTVLHVSRGTSSFMPLRWNCPPELAVLELRSGRSRR